MVHNFQHNWETNPQFRALWSGGLGLTIVVMLCACLGVAFTFAGTVAGRLANSGSQQAIAPSGTPRNCGADCNITFPTPTIPSWAPPLFPQANPIPPSLTPQPTPTALPTPTPVPTAVPGPPCLTNCGGTAGTVTITSTTPAQLTAGQPGSVVIHTSQPNVPVAINITWQTGGFAPYTNNGAGYPTDANGDFTLSFTVPAGGCTNGSNNSINFWITAQFSGGTVDPTITERCIP